MTQWMDLRERFLVSAPLKAAAFFIFFFLLAPYPACAGGGDAADAEVSAEGTEVVTLAELIDTAREHNPRVKAARAELERTMRKKPRARGLDDPVLTYTEPVREIETRLGPQERVFTLSQKLPFPGKLGLKADIVDREVEIARTRYEKTLRDLTAEVKKVFYELYFIDRALDLDRENKAVLDYFAEVSRTNYGLDVSELDELVRARKSSAQASFDLLMLEDMREGVVARINTLLDRVPSASVARAGEPEIGEIDMELAELAEQAARYNEEVKIAGLEVKKTELELRLAGYSWRPDFNVGVNYSQIGDPGTGVADAGEDAVAITLGVNIPIWFSKNRAAVEEQRMGLEKRLLEKKGVVAEVTNRVRKVWFDLVTSQRIMELYGERLIPEAEESVAFAEARYKTGREKLARLLEVQSMWINFRLVYYRAVANYLNSMAELERLIGREFD